MRTNYFYILAMLLILFAGCRNDQTPSTDQPEDKNSKQGTPLMEFERLYHDFETLKEGEKVSYTFTFKNTGSADLIIKDVIPSCGCTAPKYVKEPVAPGEEGTVEIIFDSQGFRGNQYKTVILKTNTPYGQKTLTIKANVIS